MWHPCISLNAHILSRYADMVAVTMVDGKKYSLDLFEEGCRRVTPVNVQYKAEKETEWQVQQ